jgi:hypothetical protein
MKSEGQVTSILHEGYTGGGERMIILTGSPQFWFAYSSCEVNLCIIGWSDMMEGESKFSSWVCAYN